MARRKRNAGEDIESPFKSVHPVRAQVINEIDGGADRPGERIGPVDVADLADEVDDRA